VCVRLERRGVHTDVVALRVSVQVAPDATQLRLRVHSVAIVDGSLKGRPTRFVPVLYDEQLKCYTIGTPPIVDEQMAGFGCPPRNDLAEPTSTQLSYLRAAGFAPAEVIWCSRNSPSSMPSNLCSLRDTALNLIPTTNDDVAGQHHPSAAMNAASSIWSPPD
jgi:hypothetical protein